MKAYARVAAPGCEFRDHLIQEHMEMARRIARRVARRVPAWLNEEDLIAAGFIGLTQAAARFEPTHGEPFIAFAEKRIRGAVFDELRRGDMLPRRVRAASRKVSEAIRKLEHALGRGPDDHEVAAELGVSLAEYREDLEMLTHLSFVDIDGDQRAESFGAECRISPADEAETAERVAHLRAALSKLETRDAQLLSLYYIEELKYTEIADVLGITESRVCQLHGRALVRMRVLLESGGTS